MRALTAVVVVLAGLWCGYWFIGARGFDTAARNWVAQVQASGRQADVAAMVVQGFPNRFDLTVTEPRLSDPATGLGWQSAFFQVLSLSYKPWHVIVAFAPEQRLTSSHENVTLRSEKLQASVVAQPVPALPLDRITLIGNNLTLIGDGGWQIAAQALRFATRRAERGENAHDIALTLTDITPDASLTARFGTALPPQIALVRLDATTAFTAPIDRMALQSHPQIASIDLGEFRVDWGQIGLSAKGRITPDSAGFAEGDIRISLENWPLALDVAQSMGVIAAKDRKMWDQAAGFLTMTATDKTRIELPLTFKNGIALIGPLPVGTAPRLR
jgi:hypothetical protein